MRRYLRLLRSFLADMDVAEEASEESDRRDAGDAVSSKRNTEEEVDEDGVDGQRPSKRTVSSRRSSS